jgi:DNA-directed RNA polymerase specialized sigma24 family protein
VADLDTHLVAIGAGDRRAFASWVAGAEMSLRASLRRYAAFVDAEAVIQETLLRIWQLAPRVRPDGTPNALLRLAVRIARNLATDEVRRRGRPVPVDLHDEPAFAEPAGDPWLWKHIVECREKLRHKPALALDSRIRSAGAEPDRVLAARLNMRLNTFLQNVARARRQLADCLRRKGVPVEER